MRDVAYALSFELADDRDSYLGRSIISFELDDAGTPLWVDFVGRVSGLSLNGDPLEPDHHGGRLWLPGERLEAGNTLIVEYENVFDRGGDGFHRFVDPEDGAVYVYSNFEPFYAHRLFPCFDQPDIKARYELSVRAPAAWRVVSAGGPESIEPLEGDRAEHRFAPVGPLSTYVFSLIAGPYERIERMHGSIPLGLLGRRSMRKQLEASADELFEVTGQGLDYFEDLFGRSYAFGKYDQIFVPEFNAGAMENVAAVTFHDSFIFRDPPTYSQRLMRAEVVLHELAHMWFGDLVTMRWWDDLWLNETFATYLSYRCLAEATRFEDAWLVFNGQMRPAAFRQDQLVTTHPVATSVEHTDQAKANFDAITYEKGAAVIKQLVASLGEDAFRDGLRRYFERHAWSNATLEDFLGALGVAAGLELDEWARVWLQTPSLNTLGVEWSSADGRVATMDLWQRAPERYPTLRPHTTSVALVDAAGTDGRLEVTSLPVRIDGSRVAVPGASGRSAPLFVYPDHDDHDYALSELDEVSLGFALGHLPELPEPLLRQQVWSVLWEMVRDARLPSTRYLEAVARFAPGEVDRGLLQAILDRAIRALQRFVPADRAEDAAGALFATAIEASSSATEPDLRLTWARAAGSIAARRGDIERLADLVDGARSVEDYGADQQLRWVVATKALAYDVDGADERLAAEAARDASDRGERAVVRARAGRPEAAAKRDAWERINGPGYGSDYLTRSAMSGFQWVHQRELLAGFRESFFEGVRPMYRSRDHAFAKNYVRWLLPDLWAEPAVLERVIALSADLEPSEGLLRRQLDEAADDLARAIRVREYAEASAAEGVA